MSRILSSFTIVFAASLLILQFFTIAPAQEIEATITIEPEEKKIVRVQGRFLERRKETEANSLSFMSSYGAVSGIDRRFSSVQTADSFGPTASIKQSNGEFLSVASIKAWSYEVDLTRRSSSSSAASAHASWLDGDGGILMIDDLLPQKSGRSAKLKIELPAGWKLYSVARAIGTNEFEIPDIEKAAFYVSRNWREQTVNVSGASLKLLVSGEWMFTDLEASEFAAEVFSSYKKMFGSVPGQNAQIALVKLPPQYPPGNWEAGTRGSSITIASSDTHFKSQSQQRLHEQLRHEIFHLWVPGSLKLSGNYDWFYEGFALYQSLKLGVEVGRIRFDDMLDTLSRAYRIDLGRSESDPTSLIGRSKNRWLGPSNTQIYARGMLVGFLSDLALLSGSKGKRSSTDLVREFVSQNSQNATSKDGNEALISLFRSHGELVPILERYILGADTIDWNSLLQSAGLETEAGRAAKLRVTEKPSGGQKALLNKLGYNTWRRLSKKSK